MKKNKLLAFLSVGLVSVGAVSAAAAFVANDSLEYNALENDVTCGLYFSHKNQPTLTGTSGEALGSLVNGGVANSYTKLFYENAAPSKKGNVVLNENGYVWTNGTEYSAAQGWGSVTNNLKNITVQLLSGSVELSTAYDADDTWNVVKTFTTADVDMYTIPVMNVTPRYFKLKAVGGPAEIKSFNIGCSHTDNPLGAGLSNGEYRSLLIASVIDETKNIPEFREEYRFTVTDGCLELPTFKIDGTKLVKDAQNITIKNSSEGENSSTIFSINRNNNDKNHEMKYVDGSKDKSLENTAPINNLYSLRLTGIRKVCSEIKVQKDGSYINGTIELNVGDSVKLKAILRDGSGLEVKEKVNWSIPNNTYIKFGDTNKLTTTSNTNELFINAVAATESVDLKLELDGTTKVVNFKVIKPAANAIPSGLVGYWVEDNLANPVFTINEKGQINIEIDDMSVFGTPNLGTWYDPASVNTADGITTIEYNSDGCEATVVYDDSTKGITISDYTFSKQ